MIPGTPIVEAELALLGSNRENEQSILAPAIGGLPTGATPLQSFLREIEVGFTRKRRREDVNFYSLIPKRNAPLFELLDRLVIQEMRLVEDKLLAVCRE